MDGQTKSTNETDGVISGLALIFMASFFFYNVFIKESPPKTDETAFNACKSQLELIAHPAWTTVPRVDGRFDGPTYYFSWPGSLVFGGRSAAASCFVDRETLEITSLTVNGKERIWRRPESP